MDYRKKRGIISFALIIFAGIFSTSNYDDFVVGDYLLNKIGLPSWSNGTSGLHYSAIVSLVLIIIGLIGLYFYSNDVHPKLWTFTFIIIFFGAFIYQSIFSSICGITKTYSKGLDSIGYYGKESSLKIESGENNESIRYTGTLKLKNYSFEDKSFYVKFIPNERMVKYSENKYIFIADLSNNSKLVKLGPKEELYVTVFFDSKPKGEIENFTGNYNWPDIVICNGNQEKRFIRREYN